MEITFTPAPRTFIAALLTNFLEPILKRLVACVRPTLRKRRCFMHFHLLLQLGQFVLKLVQLLLLLVSWLVQRAQLPHPLLQLLLFENFHLQARLLEKGLELHLVDLSVAVFIQLGDYSGRKPAVLGGKRPHKPHTKTSYYGELEGSKAA